VCPVQVLVEGIRRTVPVSPSTSISWPSVICAVAFPVPTTAGMPYSRTTTAQWLRMPPVSETTAAAVAKSGVHGGAVAPREPRGRRNRGQSQWHGVHDLRRLPHRERPRCRHCGGVRPRPDAAIVSFPGLGPLTGAPSARRDRRRPVRFRDARGLKSSRSRPAIHRKVNNQRWPPPVGCQNAAMALDQRFQAAVSYSLSSPPKIGRRRTLPWTGRGSGDVSRGARNRSARCGRAVL
jgi:hypothetical protein